jgi:hypothetical protein
VLSFSPELATKLNKFGVIPILADILSDAQKEKVLVCFLHPERKSSSQEKENGMDNANGIRLDTLNPGPDPVAMKLTKI